MDYDFSQLNDKELEILAADLLSTLFDARFERFKGGKDGGVDGRFFCSPGQEVVFQCKHYRKSGFPALVRSLRNSELQKVKILTPSRYLLVTSCSLSRHEKRSIAELLSPYLKEDDVLGSEDLNDLLRKNPEIELAHTKLWMSSTAILRRFLNNAVFGRSEDLINQIASKRKFYVETRNFLQARSRLEASHVIILSGEPGIGKTTLAENLCLLYSTHGFEIVDTIKDLSEAEQAFQEGVPQLFLFDDFLGGNYLEAIGGREDAHVVKFMKRVLSDHSKRFILTTRTNIFNLGIAASDHLNNSGLRKDEYLLKIEDLSRYEKAQILYNHIWHSNLTEEYIEEIYKDNKYIRLIDHRNYSPRLIEFVTDPSKLGFPASATDYPQYIAKNLDNPALIWRNALMVQSNDYMRTLVKLVVFNGGRMNEPQLAGSFARYSSKFISKSIYHGDIEFESVARKASESFLTRSIDRNKYVSYILLNPSIADFIINEYRNNAEEIARVFDCLDSTEALLNLTALRTSRLLDNGIFELVTNYLVEYSHTSKKSLDYRIVLVDTEIKSEAQNQRKNKS